MDFFVRTLLLLTFVYLAMAQEFQQGMLSQFPAAPVPGRFQAQRPAQVPQKMPVQDPVQYDSKPAQRPVRIQTPNQARSPMTFQLKKTFDKPFTWRYPEDPVEPAQPDIEFELKQPVPATSVAVHCGRNFVHVEAKRDLLGIGQFIQPADLTLGGCATTGEDATAQILIFESELHGCGSTLTMTEDALIYLFTLHYKPTTLGSSPIVRTRDMAISVECHYQRKHDVSSNVVEPTWMPYASTKVAEELLYFSLKLMTGDWQFERPSNQYFLGDVMKFEASVKQFYQVPLRVFVDSCVATLIPNINTVPRYAFLGNHGCLIDAKLTGSSSQFMPRTQNDKLQFQIEAFKFQHKSNGPLYITCRLKASTASASIDAENKACSFSNGWGEASGSDQACGCCDTTCGAREGQNPLSEAGVKWEQEANIGPINVKERSLD